MCVRVIYTFAELRVSSTRSYVRSRRLHGKRRPDIVCYTACPVTPALTRGANFAAKVLPNAQRRQLLKRCDVMDVKRKPPARWLVAAVNVVTGRSPYALI
ncbi:hypothetical protein EVAR_79950_1 [Eumeta japonica]|uniref:Uncharacterized protein n=1 Tax=Eumeta variegata TaxID=151549 RepID=A0A4C1Y5A3_EUMVA|nr:hypothetical protein EVAR_79950_1 [Eumeta japonica]